MRPRSIRAVRRVPGVLGVSAAILCGSANAQQFADERVLLGADPHTASVTKLVHGDVDGDGWDELVVRNVKSTDWVLRGGPTDSRRRAS